MIKYEVMKLVDTSLMDTTQVNYPHYTLYVDRVKITLQPRRAPGYQVHLSPRVDQHAFTLTDLARSLPETDYSEETLGQKIFQAQEADIRDFVVGNLFRWYKCSSDDKRRILLNLKPGINTTDLFKKSTDLVAGKNKRFPFYLDFHLMSLEDLLNIFSGSEDGKREILAKLI